jgi:hypothetical protein
MGQVAHERGDSGVVACLIVWASSTHSTLRCRKESLHLGN